MTRIGGTARVFALALALAATTGVNAQTFSGNWRLNPFCGGVESASLTTGCVEEESSLGGHCVACGLSAGDDMTTWSRTASRGSIAAYTHVEGMQYTPSPCGAAVGGTSELNQTVRANDVIFTRISDPNATGTVSVSLNVEFRGHVEALPACTAEYAQVDICTQIVGTSCATSGSLRTVGSLGVLATYANDRSTLSLTSSSRSATLGVAVDVTLDLKVKTGDTQCESLNPTASDSTAIGELTLPPSGPVFVLPFDITVNSVQLGIVDNQWVGAAPVVTDPPAAQSVCTGDRADFSVGASGGAVLQYQWRRNGVDLTDGPTGTGSTIVGATSNALSVFDVAGADTGSYDCVVGNGCLSTASDAGALALAPADADAGADHVSDELIVVTLDGSGSAGPGCTPPSPSWLQLGGVPVTLDATNPLHPTFVAPEVGPGGGALTFRLDVEDGAGGTVSDMVTVTVVNVGGDVDADGVQDVDDCAPLDPTAFAFPAEVAGVSFSAADTFTWASVAVAAGSGSVYDVMRGDLSELPVGGGASESCLAPSTASLQATDLTVSGAGTGLYYLVRARNACGVGSYGAATGAVERAGTACP